MSHPHIRNSLSAAITLVLTAAAAMPASAFAQEAAAAAETRAAQEPATVSDRAADDPLRTTAQLAIFMQDLEEREEGD